MIAADDERGLPDHFDVFGRRAVATERDGVRLDGVMSAVPTLDQAIKSGSPIKLLDGPLFFEPLAVAIDKSSTLDPASLVSKISRIIQQMHVDGTLSTLSMKWYGEDLTVAS